jgi:hypothetical protein
VSKEILDIILLGAGADILSVLILEGHRQDVCASKNDNLILLLDF